MDLEVQKEVQQARKSGEKEREMKERFGSERCVFYITPLNSIKYQNHNYIKTKI